MRISQDFVDASGYGALNGNGNGAIDSNSVNIGGPEVGLLEPSLAGLELQQAKFIGIDSYDRYGYPIIKMKLSSYTKMAEEGGWYIQYMYSVAYGSVTNTGHYYWATSLSTALKNDGIDGSILSSGDAYGIDGKIDDGMPRSGKVLADGGYAAITTHIDTLAPIFDATVDATAAAGASNPQCITNASPNTYNFLNEKPYSMFDCREGLILMAKGRK